MYRYAPNATTTPTSTIAYTPTPMPAPLDVVVLAGLLASEVEGLGSPAWDDGLVDM